MFLLTILLCSIIFSKFSNKSTFLDDVSLKDNMSSSNSFAIMIENENGEYEEYSGSSWPTNMLFNSELSGCIDNNGNTVQDVLSYSSGKVSVKTSKSTYCYLYFDIREPDILVTTTVNGTTSSVPTTGAYTVTTSTGSYWNSKYRTLNITSVSSNSNSKYTLEFTTDSSTKTNFRDYIVSLLDEETSVVSGNGYLVDEGDVYYGDYTNAYSLAEADYGTTSQFSSNSVSSTSGTTVTVWSYADGVWTSDASAMTSTTYYHLSTIIDTSGYYQMCYSMTDGSSYNNLFVYVNGIAQYINGPYTYIASSTSSAKSGCVDLGYIAGGSSVEFIQLARSYESYSISSMSVSLKLGETSFAGEAGYRYEGESPNNYVWFNNEMWRIIGVIPTVVDEDGTTENLVKIIRAESLGSFAYDGKSSGYTGVWGSNTLYTLLNSYYWGALDGTGTDHCMGHSTRALPNCNFVVSGIQSTSYYGSMVEYVYWNTGASDCDVTPKVAYANETATQTVGGYVGIMNASDYGYALYSEGHLISMYHYNEISTLTNHLLNWLYHTGHTWTMTAYTSSNKTLMLSNLGEVEAESSYYGFAVLPVVYLKSDNVYLIDGDGSEANPYQLGIG